jgi:hypothetical protein
MVRRVCPLPLSPSASVIVGSDFMKRLLVICTFVFLGQSALVFGEVNPAAVREIVLAEFAAMKLPMNSPFCLEVLPAQNLSEAGADPSPQLLQFLIRKGIRPRKASSCYRPFPKET